MKRVDLSAFTFLQTISMRIDSPHSHTQTRPAFPRWLSTNIHSIPSEHPLRRLVFNIFRPHKGGHFDDLDMWSPLDEIMSTRGQLRMSFNVPCQGQEIVTTFHKAIKAALPRSDQLGLVCFG